MTPKHVFSNLRMPVALPAVLVFCVALTVALDILYAKSQQTSFYFSESLLFSSFWCLFLPFLFAQFYFSGVFSSKLSKVWLITFPIFAHLLSYPAIVWVISGLFFEHQFAYGQTLRYELTSYSFVLLLVYTLPLTLFNVFKRKNQKKERPTGMEGPNNALKSLLVTDGNKRVHLKPNDILYILANPPYINIHHPEKRYLHAETLKSILGKLDPALFARVHKSAIVNLEKVQTIKSRLNGDYDLTMTDGTEIRLSRNYVAGFRQVFKNPHQDTTE